MSYLSLTVRGGALLAAVLVAVPGCGRDTRVDPALQHQIDDMALNAQRDSLLGELAANAQLLTDIETELAKVRKPAPAAPESAELHVTLDDRELVLTHVREVAARLKDLQSRLVNSERRVRKLTAGADSLRGSLSRADSTIADLNTLVGSQQAAVSALTAQVEALLGENAVLADSVMHLTEEQRTAYFVVGTRQELLDKGVLVPDGHRSFPLIGRRGVAPARDLPLQEFTSIDRTAITEIALPDSSHKYRIVSRQNVSYLEPTGRAPNRVRGSIRIREPEQFWEPSRYLIVVED